MIRYRKLLAIVAAIAAGALISQINFTPPAAGAQKPTSSARFSVVELGTISSIVNRVSNKDNNGTVIVIGIGTAGGYSTGAVAIVDFVNKKLLSSFFLPKPTDGMALDASSSAADINQHGVIVGGADVFNGVIDNNHRVFQPCRWLPVGGGFEYELLPVLDGDTGGEVVSINDAGWMVGRSEWGPNGKAVIWTPAGDLVSLLQGALPVDSGWTGLWPCRINNWNEIVGDGLFNGVETGFVVTIDPVQTYDSNGKPVWDFNATISPLAVPAGAVRNIPASISSTEEVTGTATYADGSNIGTFEDSTGRLWVLPSATASGCSAAESNARRQIVGLSEDPTVAVPSSSAFLSTLWEPITGGGYKATLLDSLVPSKPAWKLFLSTNINEQGCIGSKGRKFDKGVYTWTCVLLVPNQ